MGRPPSPVVVKAWSGGIGLALGLLGIALDQRWLVWVAVVLLVAAFLLRFARWSRPEP